MPTLTQVYEQYQRGAFYRTLCRWLNGAVTPWHLGETRIYFEANYFTFGTDICIRTELLPDMAFWCAIRSDDLLNLDDEGLLVFVTEEFLKWFRSIHILPEDNIELGEN